MDEQGFIGDNRPEDIRWLHSLSESELDLLVSLKTLVLQRAKVVQQESLAQKFDLRVLRALGFVLMQYMKHRLNESKDILDGLNSLKLDLVDIDQCATSDCEAPQMRKYEKKKYDKKQYNIYKRVKLRRESRKRKRKSESNDK